MMLMAEIEKDIKNKDVIKKQIKMALYVLYENKKNFFVSLLYFPFISSTNLSDHVYCNRRCISSKIIYV